MILFMEMYIKSMYVLELFLFFIFIMLCLYFV